MKSRGHAPKMQRNASQRLALEQRIVFDAAIGATGAELLDRHADRSEYIPPATRQPLRDTKAEAANPAAEQALQVPKEADAPPVKGVTVVDSPRVVSASTEIIFVDASVKDVQKFLAGRSGEVVLLQAGRDGVEQIAAALAGRTGVSAIHILSHGDAGKLHLGGATLDQQGISGRYAEELSAIRLALTDNADILIYGCDVAAGSKGQAFVTALAAATGADIAASTNLTGALGRGGDWVLESTTGAIETTALALASFDGLLTTQPPLGQH